MAPANNSGERITALEVSVKDNSVRIVDLASDLDEKHRENRRAIHELRNGQQGILDKVALTHMEILDKMHARDLQIVKTQARWAGMAAAGGFLLTMLAPFAQEAIKHLLTH